MTDDHAIDTTAEHAENAAIADHGEIHTDPNYATVSGPLPPAIAADCSTKSPAKWMYERVILYIQKFEQTLDNDHEVGLGFASSDAGVMRIEGLGYFDPDIVTYFGTDASGAKTQLIQHVGQTNVMLRAAPRNLDHPEPTRIGFRLAKALESVDADVTESSTTGA